MGLFAASSVMMGWLGTLPLAAHGIGLQITSAIFMVHVGLSNVATVRAGQAIGRDDGQGLRDGARTVLAVSGVVAFFTVIVFLSVPGLLIGLFLDPVDPLRAEVIAIGRRLLAAAALFQVVDAAQVLSLGLLRGVQDTRVPMMIAALSYWAVGISASYLLGFTFGLGGAGVWLGLALGLALAGVFMLWRFWGWAVRKVPV
jgi:MATE family multidrug resistance protein